MSRSSDLTWYTRKTLPEHWRDPSKWPSVDLDAFGAADRKRYWSFHKALSIYLSGESLARAARDYEVSKAELLRQLNRCVTLHPDERIYGWRALQAGVRVVNYRRSASTSGRGKRIGLAGAFEQLLHEHPAIQEALDAKILKRRNRRDVHEILISAETLHGVFLERCIDAGIATNEYPRNVKSQGKSALTRYIQRKRSEVFEVGARLFGGDDAATRAQVGTHHEKHLHADFPGDICSMDAHKLDFLGTIAVPTDHGLRNVPLQRMQLITLVDHASTAVFGYHVVMRQECRGRDVLRAARNAIEIWKPRKLSLPGQKYPPTAGMPSYFIPSLGGCCWAVCLLDNAAIHYSESVCEHLRRRVGWALNFGPVGKWYRRGLIESVYSSLEQQGFQRLPNSTGGRPGDPLRRNAAQSAVTHTMTWEQMFDLVDIVIATYNGKPKKALGWRSPIELLRDWTDDTHRSFLLRCLPQAAAGSPELDSTTERHTVRGNLKDGRRPYIEIDHAHYTNELLSKSASLIGVELRMHVRDEDMRTVVAFLPGGAELGVLTAKGSWGRFPHDRQTRKLYFSLTRDRKLVLLPNEEPIQAVLRLKSAETARHASKRANRQRISKAGTELASIVRATGLAVPGTPSADASKTNAARQPERLTSTRNQRKLPSFMPRVIHRTIIR